jgi:hypothetical protein
MTTISGVIYRLISGILENKYYSTRVSELFVLLLILSKVLGNKVMSMRNYEPK